jgi:tetratricopeptide (TPR) repeat protein
MSLRISQKNYRNYMRLALAVAMFTAVCFVWRPVKRWLFPVSALVSTPQIALEKLEARSLYYNSEAGPWLVQRRADLLTAEDKDEKSARVVSFSQAPQSPRLFRQLDRQYRFDTVLLVDDPSRYQRLLDHLLDPEPDKRDFKLVYLDHWALVFKRGAKREWESGDLDAVRQLMAGLHSEDRAAFLAMTAMKMLAVRQSEAAKRWLDEALSVDGSSVDALTGLAQYYVWLGKWKEAEVYADKVLAQNENCVGAVAVKVLTMRATKHMVDAFKLSEKLNNLIPEDPVRLWQHAQLAHESQQFGAEIVALTRLIKLAKDEERPVGEYEFHLGEAHAFAAMKDGTHAPMAVEHLGNALADPSLPADKRKFAEERLATIRERTGLH